MNHIVLVVLCFLLLLDSIPAFQPKRSLSRAGAWRLPLHASSLDVTGKNIEVTDALRERIENKIGGILSKLGENVISTSVTLRVESNDPSGSDIVDCNVNLKGGSTIHVSEAQTDMYVSIDFVANKIGEKLKQAKSKQKAKDTHRR